MKVFQWVKSRKPWVFENSKIPVWLSNIAPIDIWALSFAFWVFCRGKMSSQTRRHETIHYQQQIELLFVGQWVLYGTFWLIGLARYKDGKKAYYNNQVIIEIDAKYLRPSEVDSLKGNSKKARTKLKWKPKHTINTLIDDMIKDFNQ